MTSSQVDETALDQVLGQAVTDIGATLNAALAVIGDKLGLYKALAADGPLTPQSWPSAPARAERYVREWLAAQAAGGYVDYDRRGHATR